MNADGLRRVRGSTGVKSAARMGLVGRGVFYLILAALTLEVVLQPRGSGPQANANGALSEVAKSPVGLVLVAAAGVGFVAFGMVRLAGAITDDRHGWLRRVSTAGQGLMYLALAATTASFLLGRHGAGSEQQQRRTASTVLGLPGGRALLAVAGLAVLGVGCWQLVVAARGKFEDTLHTEQMSTKVHRLTRLTARIGIPARTLALSPVARSWSSPPCAPTRGTRRGPMRSCSSWPIPAGARPSCCSSPPGSWCSRPTPSSKRDTAKSAPAPERGTCHGSRSSIPTSSPARSGTAITRTALT